MSAGRTGNVAEVFLVFLKLGLTSFGGPIAHLGYFRDEFVSRRGWFDDKAYADLVALCQFLPGPASSQVGFAIGLMRAGGPGALAAWAGFTLPSALLMLAIALGAGALSGDLAQGVLHGLKLVAVAVVAQAVLGMAKSLTPDKVRAGIAVLAVAAMVIFGGVWGQVGAIVLGGVLGLWLCRGEAQAVGEELAVPVSRTVGVAALLLFAGLLLVLPLVAGFGQGLAVFDAFYRAGALVFGGGHVVLPLLEAGTVRQGWLDQNTFLAGYGAAQAMPGPLFTFASYLGAASGVPPNGAIGAAIALVAIFLPGMLIVLAALPFWHGLRGNATAQAAMRGANAAVVGILGLALYNPVFTSAVLGPVDFVLALAGFVALVSWKVPPLAVVVALAGIGGVMGVVG
ncbi:chromate efflux transporter [Devosia sp. Leaf64]|uniref:chromate efflux transporter n=1 Tax=Devosia sp. Leaf64 TaxID=1736229 RepID=UPI00071346D3|nr:chromate efflux transporter [Devosia sp. Leaf64]KQN72230.1 chromate transporter [Devosia sp. Leaf64]